MKEIYKILTDVAFEYKQKYMRGDKVAENCFIEQAKALSQYVIKAKIDELGILITELYPVYHHTIREELWRIKERIAELKKGLSGETEQGYTASELRMMEDKKCS